MSKLAGDPFSQMRRQLAPDTAATSSARKVKGLATTAEKYYTHHKELRALPDKRPLWDYYPEAKYSPTYIMRLVNEVEQWIRQGAPVEAQGHYYAKWLVELAVECEQEKRPPDPALAFLVRISPALQLLAGRKGKRGKRHSKDAAHKWFRQLVNAKKAIDAGAPVRKVILGEQGKLRQDYYRLAKPLSRSRRKNLPRDIAIERVKARRQFRQEYALQIKLDALHNINNTNQP